MSDLKKLEAENKKLRAEIASLKKKLKESQATVERLALMLGGGAG